MKSIGEALSGVLRHLKAEGVIESIRVMKVAREVLKPYDAEVIGYDKGILFIWVGNPAKRFEIVSKKNGIISSINRLLGDNKVYDIKFRKVS